MAPSTTPGEPTTGIRSCLASDGSALKMGLSPDEMRKALASGGGLLWVDIRADGREHGEPILRDIFGFHALTIDDCYNEHIDPPKVDDYGEYLFLIVHDVEYDESASDLRTDELDLYVGSNYVVSVHRAPSQAVEDVLRRADLASPVVNRGPAFLAHALIDVVVDGFHPVVEVVETQMEALEESVLAHPERDKLEQILRMKRIAQRLRRTISPQRDVVNRLSRGEYPRLIADEALVYFRDIYDHTVRVHETIESVRDLGESALNIYLSSVNNKINEVMRTLAVVTVIFLPLTLIAGIYGTNFANVPEYEWRLGYSGMLVLMGVIALSLLAWFRYRKWF